VVDIVWFHDDYLELFAASGLDLVAHHTPLGRDDEPHNWLSETSIAPWVIYFLRKQEASAGDRSSAINCLPQAEAKLMRRRGRSQQSRYRHKPKAAALEIGDDRG